ncbi:hypothetical protein M0R45_021355 [Rubus argutus]|uniref:Uncharacterized protein n=1 Tax=Rubus argutus TaxID=59490 RepID=A0AAW1XCT4_RUBAR
MGSNWKKKGGKKAKSKKKAKKKLQESSEKSDEFRPFTEAEQRLLDAWAKDDKVMRSTEHDCEVGADSDETYMLALTGNINLSEETLRQLHEAKSERFKYFMEYGMFEEEWLQLKKKYPNEFVGEFPHNELDAKPESLLKESPTVTSHSGISGEVVLPFPL